MGRPTVGLKFTNKRYLTKPLNWGPWMKGLGCMMPLKFCIQVGPSGYFNLLRPLIAMASCVGPTGGTQGSQVKDEHDQPYIYKNIYIYAPVGPTWGPIWLISNCKMGTPLMVTGSHWCDPHPNGLKSHKIGFLENGLNLRTMDQAVRIMWWT